MLPASAATGPELRQGSGIKALGSVDWEAELSGADPQRTSVLPASPAQPGQPRPLPTTRMSAAGKQPGPAPVGVFPTRTPVRPQARSVPPPPRPAPPQPRAPQPAWSGPQGPAQPPAAPRGTAARGRRRRKRRPLRLLALLLTLLLVLLGVRVAALWNKVNSSLHRVDVLSGAPNTPGDTWLIVGSDSRADGSLNDGTEGARADSIMVLHKAENGTAALVTLPRDTYVNIPEGVGGNKINASYAFGGGKLLVKTVEKLTGLTIDHYTEVGMGGVKNLVDAVGGVEVCLDYDVNDADSGLVWDTAKGECQQVDGTKALAYSRMRKSDPTGDIGRGTRQRNVISKLVSKAASPSALASFKRQDALVEAGTGALTVDEDAGVISLTQMLLAFRSSSSKSLSGAPPIVDVAYEPGGIGQAVLLQDTTAPDFFAKLRAGTLTKSDFQQQP
ncbi:Membrane-bound protein lytR [Actinomyces bovis]|uniref:Membrane-bound protein lytR n=1 Tax=Actinomyces bovis TaxID=1658 RepID=A0ABY1VMS0_9ACTO|nr:LCP family protein [Actinomyces bovis]SPT53285.1 Membrane-bound protein lytR [Actinomyces bovis]VEG52584.1 Membrane-bound protein lytR [Actinomyces israelii]